MRQTYKKAILFDPAYLQFKIVYICDMNMVKNRLCFKIGQFSCLVQSESITNLVIFVFFNQALGAKDYENPLFGELLR